MSAASPSSCTRCHRDLAAGETVCSHCDAPEAVADPFALPEDWNASTALAAQREAVARAAEPEEHAPDARGWALLGLGLVALTGTAGAWCLQTALPDRFPSLMTLGVRMFGPPGAASDFFPASAWWLALASWALLALGLGVGHQLARRAGARPHMSALEWAALVLQPGLNLVSGPYVMRALGAAARSRQPALRLWLGTRALVAMLLHTGAVVLDAWALRTANEDLAAGALAASLAAMAAFVAVLCGSVRSLWVLSRLGLQAAELRGEPTRVRLSGPTLGWAAMVAAVALVIGGVWYGRADARECGSGTSARWSEDDQGQRGLACVLPDGRGQGPRWVRGHDGRLLERGEFLAGQPQGTFRTWGARGQPWEERTYASGLPHGTWTLYHPGGWRWLEQTYVEGLLEGPTTLYLEHGSKRLLKHYQKGLAHGPRTLWFDSGIEEETGLFEQGQRTGLWTRRDRSGKVLKQWNAALPEGLETASTMGGAAEEILLRAGHTQSWWKQRLELLRNKARVDPATEPLYQLTLRRARANGFAVLERPEGVVLAMEPTP